MIAVSIGPSQLGDSEGIPDWGIQTCGVVEFVDEVRRFLSEFGAALDDASPGMAKQSSWRAGGCRTTRGKQ